MLKEMSINLTENVPVIFCQQILRFCMEFLFTVRLITAHLFSLHAIPLCFSNLHFRTTCPVQVNIIQKSNSLYYTFYPSNVPTCSQSETFWFWFSGNARREPAVTTAESKSSSAGNEGAWIQILLCMFCQVNFRGKNKKLTLVREALGFWTVLREVIKWIWQETEIEGSNCGKRTLQLENSAVCARTP